MKKKIVIKESELDSLVKEVLQENEQFEDEPNVVVELLKEKIMEVQTFVDSVNIMGGESVIDGISKFSTDVLSPLLREVQKLNDTHEDEFIDELNYLYDADQYLEEVLRVIEDIDHLVEIKPTSLY